MGRGAFPYSGKDSGKEGDGGGKGAVTKQGGDSNPPTPVAMRKPPQPDQILRE